MHIETVTLERVFDLHRIHASRYGPQRTLFSFESNGQKHYAVEVNGWPQLTPGQRASFVLNKSDNWQTVCGFKNHSTGDPVISNFSRIILGIVYSLFWSLMMSLVFANSTTTPGRVASAAGVLVFLALVAMLVKEFFNARRAASMLAATD